MQTDTPSVVVRRCQCVCLRLGILTAFGWVGYIVEMSSVSRKLPIMSLTRRPLHVT